MAPMVSLFVTFWVHLASYVVESRHEQRPLCRALDSREHQQPARFPLSYTCYGDDDNAICKFADADSPEPNASNISTDEDESEAVTWWVYKGQREKALRSAGEGDEWVDCTDYYAYSTSARGPSEHVDGYPRPTHDISSKHITRTGGRSMEPTSSTAIEPIRTLPLSQSLRTLEEDGVRSSVEVDIKSSLSSPMGRGENERLGRDAQNNSLVFAPNSSCDDIWLSWPAMQERAMARGTFIVFKAISSVGNLFIIINTVMKFVQFLDLGLIINWTEVPGFRAALNPGVINWDLDAAQFMQPAINTEGANTTGLHALEFNTFSLVLSDSQLELLASTLDIKETKNATLVETLRKRIPRRINLFMRDMRGHLESHTTINTQPCAWNMLLSRSPAMIASLEQFSPWGVASDAAGPRHRTADYMAWHMRTADGETAKSYNPLKEKYIIQEPSSDVCPTYLVASHDALELAETCRASLSVHAGDDLVYISSNSKSMAKNCTVEAAKHDISVGHVDLGLDARDAHTAHSKKPLLTALGALLDFFFLLDATVIVRTGSSFSGTACLMKGLKCNRMKYNTLPKRRIMLCIPSDC